MRSILPAALLALATSLPLLAQGIQPIGQIDPHAQSLKQVAVLTVPALDRNAIATEDLQRYLNGMPPRYAIPTAVQESTARNGTWEVLDAAWSLWRLRVEAPGASHVNLGFGQVQLPGTARLMVYSADYTQVVRPFVQADVSPNGELWTPVVPGHEVVVEIYVQTVQRPQTQLTLLQVGSGYRFFGVGPTALSPLGQDPEPAGACNVDVACAQSAGWWSEIPAIAAISSGGSIFCTGFMVNNTAQDGRNFFMTANHCGVTSSNAASLVCYWNYQNAVCNVTGYNLNQFNTGAQFRAGYSTSDFTLVELNNTPNPAWGVTYAGWDHSGTDATMACGIHHPSADVKKISFENQATQTTSYGGTSVPGDGTHVRVVDWDVGTTEGGSSGSPLFNQNHCVIGQLHGGGAACGNNLSDYYGKFAVSWTGGGSSATRLSNWLDPLNTGAPALPTLGSSAASASTYGTGCYESFASFHESFGAGTLDLGGSVAAPSTVLMTRAGNSYAVTAGSGGWYTPTSANQGLTDDSCSGSLALPFTFQFIGGATNAVRLCSNGYLWLNGTTTTADYTPTVGELVAGAPRMAPLWMDLNPTTAGSTHFDLDPSGTAVYLTWLGVAEYGNATSTNDVQVAIFANGSFEYRYRGIWSQNHDALVGYSPGNGVMTPPATDISLSMPFVIGADQSGLGLRPTSRPVLGGTQTLAIDNSPAGTGFGFVLLGFTQYSHGLDLAPIGMPGCRQYCSFDFHAGVVISGANPSWSFPVPNIASFTGLHVHGQAVTLSSGVNTLGILSSNGVDMRIDLN